MTKFETSIYDGVGECSYGSLNVDEDLDCFECADDENYMLHENPYGQDLCLSRTHCNS